MNPIDFGSWSCFSNIALESQVGLSRTIDQSLSSNIFLLVDVVSNNDTTWWSINMNLNDCLIAISFRECMASELTIVVWVYIPNRQQTIFLRVTNTFVVC